MTTADRLNSILNYLGVSAKIFSENLGYNRPQIIYDIKKGKTKVFSQTLSDKIISVYPEINKVWLLTGEGEMLRSANVQNVSDSENFTQTGNVAVATPVTDSINRLLDSLADERERHVQEAEIHARQLSRCQDQIDHLISLLESQNKH